MMYLHLFEKYLCIIIITGCLFTGNCNKPFHVEESSRTYATQEEHFLPYRQKHTVEGYKEFIATYPGNIFISEAEMWIDFIHFTPYEKLDTVEGYKEFKEKYPENRYAYRADAYLGRIEAKRYEKMDTIEGYREFLEKYPENNFAGLAKKRLQELEFRKLDPLFQEKYGFDLLRYRLALRRQKKELYQEDAKRGEVNLGDFSCFASLIDQQEKTYFHTHLIYPLQPYYSKTTSQEVIARFFNPLISKALLYLDSHFLNKGSIDGFSFDVASSVNYFYGDRKILLEYYFPLDHVKDFATNKISKNEILARAIVITPVEAISAEEESENWPIPSYRGEELKKVRDWEKKWTGKRITKDTIDQVREFLSEEFYNAYKNPKEWGADELWFEIVPYRQILPTPGQIAATKKYSPYAKLDPNPRKAYWQGGIEPDEFLVGWEKGKIAGFPFPFPKSGVEIGWNIEMNSHGDTKSIHRDFMTVHRQTGKEFPSVRPDFVLYDHFTGRVDVEPVPNKPDNPKGIRRAIYQSLEAYLAYSGSRRMQLKYLKVEKPDSVWLWDSSLRKINRISESFKRSTVDETNRFPDDEFGWSGHVNQKVWKIIRRKEMVLGRHTDPTKYTRKKGQSMWSGMQLERINTYVLEVQDKDPEAPYSKEIFYVDPETWRCLQKVAWDRAGKAWRLFFYHTKIIKNKQGIEQPHGCEYYAADLQKKDSTLFLEEVKEIGQDIPNHFWTVQNLQKMGY